MDLRGPWAEKGPSPAKKRAPEVGRPHQVQCCLADGSQREGEGHDDDADDEDRGGDDRQAVQVLLEDARAGAGVVERGGNHVGDARALAGVHKNKDDGEDTGEEQQDGEDDVQRIHVELLIGVSQSVVQNITTRSGCPLPHKKKTPGHQDPASACHYLARSACFLKLHGSLHHGGEGVGLEGGTADEGTVDVLLLEEAGDVLGLGRAAVEDADAIGGLLAKDLGQGLADGAADLLGVIGRGGLAGADGPDGLVGDDVLGGVRDLQALGVGLDLVHDKVNVRAGLADLKGLAAAGDGDDAVGHEGLGLLVDVFVCFMEVVTTF